MLVLTLSVLPVILIVILCGLVSFWFIREKELLQMTCEKHNLIAQQILIEGAYDLIHLNPDVTRLVSQKNQLEIELTVAVGPEKAAIAAQLLIVKTQMMFLRIRQRALIKQTETRALIELKKIDLKVKEQAHRMTKQWQKGTLYSLIRYRRPRMQVDPHYEDFSLPTYDFGLGYSTRQLIPVAIKLQGRSPLPKFFTKLLKKENMIWSEACSTQPHQERGTLWLSHLSAVRP